MSEEKETLRETEKPKTAEEEDEELSNLLDGALSDFNTVTTKPQSTSAVKEAKQTKPAAGDDSLVWSEDFLKEAAAKFEENMQAFLSNGGGAGAPGASFMEQFQQGMPNLADNLEDSDNSDFAKAIDETLRNLSQNLKAPMNDEDILRNFSNLTNPDCDPNELLPFMQQMMQSLLSKDILYPALTSILEKYPDWLANNKSKLSSEEYDRYSKQLKLMQEVCCELDKESPADTNTVKTQRYEVILSLMHQMQDCGQPPAELAGDLGPMMNFDEHGNPQLPADFGQNACSIM